MSDHDESGADVVALFPDSDKLDHERPLSTKERELGKSFCGHYRTELSPENERAYCRDCGVERPLWEVLYELARKPERYMANRKALKREAAMLAARVEELKREERNAKGRLRKPRRELREEAVAKIRRGIETYVVMRGPITPENLDAAVDLIAQWSLSRAIEDDVA